MAVIALKYISFNPLRSAVDRVEDKSQIHSLKQNFYFVT